MTGQVLVDTNEPWDALRHTQSSSCCAQSRTVWLTGNDCQSIVDNTWWRSKCHLHPKLILHLH